MNKHTPGPWNIHKCEPNGNFSVYASGPLAYIEKESDACLIASAPDLLSALNLLLDKLHAHAPGLIDCEYTEGAIVKAEMAIAKAKGEA